MSRQTADNRPCGPDRVRPASTGRSIFLLMGTFSVCWMLVLGVWWLDTRSHLAGLDLLRKQRLDEQARSILALDAEELMRSATRLAGEDCLKRGLASGRMEDCAALMRHEADPLRPLSIVVLDRQGRPVATRGDPDILKEMTPARSELLRNREAAPFPGTFFLRAGEELARAAARPVGHEGTELGWVIVARQWDEDELERFGRLTGGAFAIRAPGEPAPPPKNDCDRVTLSGLLRGPGGEDLGSVVLDMEAPRVHIVRSALATHTMLLGLFAAGGTALLAWALRSRVCGPIALIVESIRRHRPDALQHLAGLNTDLGGLARLVRDFFRNEAHLEEEMRRLRQSREELTRLYAAIEHSPDTIVITDLTGAILYANPAFEESTGYSRQEALGQNPRILKSGLHPPEFYTQMWRSLCTEGIWRGEISNRRKNGSIYIEYATISRIPGPDGEPIGYVAVKTDITERKRAEFELRRHAADLERTRSQLEAQARELTVARDRALESVRARSEFLARISHELRTPLNGIIGMLDMMMLTGLPDEQHECALAALDSAKRLLGILTDIIEFSRLESETLESCMEETDIAALLDEAWAGCRQEAERKGVRLTIVVDANVPPVAVLDRANVLGALEQLCRNAVKFTLEGEASIRVSLEQGIADAALRFEVADTGIGIAPDRLDDLFEPFQQAESFSTRRFGGTGLGLAIVRRLVESWGGSLGVDSTPGKGSRFHFTVPLREADRRAA